MRCPDCGSPLAEHDPPGPFSPLRYLNVQLLGWAALVFALTFFLAREGEGEPYAALAFLAGAAWLLLRPRQRAAAEALLARREYTCIECGARFQGGELRRLAPGREGP